MKEIKIDNITFNIQKRDETQCLVCKQFRFETLASLLTYMFDPLFGISSDVSKVIEQINSREKVCLGLILIRYGTDNDKCLCRRTLE